MRVLFESILILSGINKLVCLAFIYLGIKKMFLYNYKWSFRGDCHSVQKLKNFGTQRQSPLSRLCSPVHPFYDKTLN